MACWVWPCSDKVCDRACDSLGVRETSLPPRMRSRPQLNFWEFAVVWMEVLSVIDDHTMLVARLTLVGDLTTYN